MPHSYLNSIFGTNMFAVVVDAIDQLLAAVDKDHLAITRSSAAVGGQGVVDHQTGAGTMLR